MRTHLAKALTGLGLVVAIAGVGAPSADARGETLTVAPDDQKHEICIVEGANICPPEELEIVAPCITTSMLAGDECPHKAEGNPDDRPTEATAFAHRRG